MLQNVKVIFTTNIKVMLFINKCNTEIILHRERKIIETIRKS